mgnify:CR=1 FL=1
MGLLQEAGDERVGAVVDQLGELHLGPGYNSQEVMGSFLCV